MRLFFVSLVAACALMAAMAGSAVAGTDSHFPDGVPMSPTAGVTGCTVLSTSPATATGSSTGLGNKVDLFVDACLGGP
jgi:hypothetical protein